MDVRVALEQFTGHDGARDGILFIYYVVHEEKKVWGKGRGCRGKGVSRGGRAPGRGPQSLGWDTGMGQRHQPEVLS